MRAALERGTRDDLNALVALLEGDLLAHARAEEEHFYPVVDELVREHGRATATMLIDHEAIAKQVVIIASGVERLRATKERMARMEARAAVRDALLRLDTLLAVHLDKEERVYLPLLERHLEAAEQAALNDRLHDQAVACATPGSTSGGTSSDEIDVRRIPQRERHPAIFAAFDRLAVGGSFTLVSDHDPRPLSYQFAAEHSSSHTWEYLERGPLWRVRVTRIAPG